MGEAKTITSMMEEKRVFNPPKEISEKAYVKSLDEYKRIYQRSIDDPEGFWGELAEQLDWYKKWDKVLVEDFKEAKHEWFVGGKLNVCYNCVDRHLAKYKNKAAIIYVPEPPDESHVTLTYQELYVRVNELAALLRDFAGLEAGDRVTLHMPMVPELPITMLACARLGVA